MDEGSGDGNHARVSLFLILSLTRTHLGLFRIITRMLHASHSPNKHLVTSYLALLHVFTQMQDVGVLVNDSLPHSNSHTLESVAGMFATAVNRRDNAH